MGENGNGENGESHRGMITSKLTEISRKVVKEEMGNCPKGLKHEIEIENLKEGVSEMKGEITVAFEKFTDKLEQLFNERYENAKDERKEDNQKFKWSIEQGIIILFGLTGLITQILLAFKK